MQLKSPSTLDSLAPTCLHDAASQEAGVPCLLLQVGLHPSQPCKLAAHAPLEGVLLALQQRAKKQLEAAKHLHSRTRSTLSPGRHDPFSTAEDGDQISPGGIL